MSLNHSQETQKNLIARIPTVTGRDIPEWFTAIENGPAFLRCDERSRASQAGRLKRPAALPKTCVSLRLEERLRAFALTLTR